MMDLGITRSRKRRLLAQLYAQVKGTIGFADVGSGGALKEPWNLLPAEQLRKYDFEPTAGAAGLPLCVSNHTGRAAFHVALDERASSFHEPSQAFIERFGMPQLRPARTIEVECTTLDAYFADRYRLIDAVDVNVEGHDYQALQGATRLFETGWVKLLKVEFETAGVWQGQGWFGDIDSLMRSRGYLLASIDIEFARAANVAALFHKGEPLWGKAIYVPGPALWAQWAESVRGSRAELETALAGAIALYVAADLPGHAVDAVDLGSRADAFTRVDAARLRADIAAVYRWSKVETAVSQLGWLMRRAIGAGSAAHA